MFNTGLLRSWVVALLLLATNVLFAATELEQSDVFVAGKDGYHTYRIPVMVTSTNGTVLAFCEGRKNSKSDTGKIDLLLKRSKDGGRTWSNQETVWADGDNVCGNPAPVLDEVTGEIVLLMTWNLGSDNEKDIKAGTSKETRRVYVTRSADDGVSWSKPEEITSTTKKPDWKWYATGPANGIQLKRGTHKGRLVIPANHSFLENTQSVYRAHVIFSDDYGRTWKLGGD